MNRTTRRLGAAAATVLAVVVLAALPASAHIEPSPVAVEEGASTVISFDVEHGCGDSGSVKFEVKLPEGVTKPVPKAPDGWTGSVADGVVTFTGGPQDHETPLTLAIQMTVPSKAGAIAFPIIQTCEEGSIDWIEITKEGQPEPEHPAPVVTITAAAPTKEELTPPEEEGADDAGATTTTVASTTTSATSSSSSDDDSSSSTPLIAGVAVIAVIAIGGGAYVLSRRRSAS